MTTPRRIDSIDGLRAIAMTMVVAFHCGLLPFGWTGVWLFFVISGYVITLGFLPSVDRADAPRSVFTGFLRRRAIRIVPVYLLYIGINVPVILLDGNLQNLWDLPYLFSFVYNWRMVFDLWPSRAGWGMFAHLWTLSVEQQFYLFFPLLMLAVSPTKRTRWCVWLIIASPLLRMLASILYSKVWGDERGAIAFAIYASSFLHFDAFLIGALIAMHGADDFLARILDRYLLPVIALLAVSYVVTYTLINIGAGAKGADALRNLLSGYLYGQYREVLAYVVVDGVAACALWYALKPSLYSGWLGVRWLAWVGRISYGGYLFHMLGLGLLGTLYMGSPKDLPIAERLGFFLLEMAFTVAVASASFVWFETPLARRLRATAGTSRSGTAALSRS